MYQTLSSIASKYFSKHTHTLFKHVFNLSPMYRRTTGRITNVSKDMFRIEVKIPLSYKNKNYVGTIFGGSLFSATDPIYMVQLIQILGKDYVVWDKTSMVWFKRPANETAYVVFEFTQKEIQEIKNEVDLKKELDHLKIVKITDQEGRLFCEIEKVLYIADKDFYREKRKKKEAKSTS